MSSWPPSHGGSSPLARGARRQHRIRAGRSRIIPARAGSTGGDDLGWVGTGDHPRSRGEHSRCSPTPAKPSGSSPLARGARHWWADTIMAARIIPARAGSTRAGWSLWRGPPDHPRSRGEHLVSHSRASNSSGSSPLARGARGRIPPPLTAKGIIPARAGSTASPSRYQFHASDHPRSRGEHPCVSGAIVCFVGSSPLARGARPRRLPSPRRARIIPARAGSTDRETDGRRPRSWIIPARAGSTAAASRMAAAGGDHPRSRGEHGREGPPACMRSGSSPLARGALRRVCHLLGVGGIIPARAGSTVRLGIVGRCP